MSLLPGAWKIERKIERMMGGQTMTEYALILATVALVLISLYSTAGSIIELLVSRVDPLL